MSVFYTRAMQGDNQWDWSSQWSSPESAMPLVHYKELQPRSWTACFIKKQYGTFIPIDHPNPNTAKCLSRQGQGGAGLWTQAVVQHQSMNPWMQENQETSFHSTHIHVICNQIQFLVWS